MPARLLAAQPHILVVDDDDRLRLLLRRYLTEQGCVVSTAASAAAARARLPQLSYDLLVLDIMMPRLNGFEVAKRLKADLRTEPIPILFLSAKGNHGNTLEFIGFIL